MKDYKLLKEDLNFLEQNYLKWVEFWSLFNGALLVAYYNIPDYKEFLNILIPILGVIASYCWFLSIIGHRSWILSKQSQLLEFCIQEKEIHSNKHFDFQYTCNKEAVLPHFHSTYKIIKLFVFSVLGSWIAVLSYSLKIDIAIGMILFIALIAIEYKLHYIIGSDLSAHLIMGKEARANSSCFLKRLKSSPYICDIIIMISLGLLICWLIANYI